MVETRNAKHLEDASVNNEKHHHDNEEDDEDAVELTEDLCSTPSSAIKESKVMDEEGSLKRKGGDITSPVSLDDSDGGFKIFRKRDDDVPLLPHLSSASKSSSPAKSIGSPGTSRDLANRMSINLKHHGSEIVFYYFPDVPPECLFQPIIFDFKDTRDGHSHWGHKPDAYVNTMKWIAQQDDLRSQYSAFYLNFLDVILCEPGLKSAKVKNIKINGNSIRISHKCILLTVSKTVKKEDLLDYLKEKMLFLCNDVELRGCYFTQATLASGSENLKRHVNAENGAYWEMFEGALFNSRLEPFSHLSEVIIDASIKAILPNYFNQLNAENVVSASSLPFKIRRFAYGPV